MAKRKQKMAASLKYFAATAAGDWWYVNRGMNLQKGKLPEENQHLAGWVVTGWDHARDSVWVASEHQVKVYPPEELGFAWVMEPVR